MLPHANPVLPMIEFHTSLDINAEFVRVDLIDFVDSKATLQKHTICPI
jgi:hypothetical protein